MYLPIKPILTVALGFFNLSKNSFHLVKSGSLNQYLTMKHYVEWPDSTLKYDKQKRAWVSTIGL